VQPPLGQYAGSKTKGKTLDLTGARVNDFELILALGAHPPIFEIAQQQNPYQLIQYYKNTLTKQIYTAFSVDSLLDVALTSSNATATEVISRNNMRDILLYGMITNTVNQLLTPLVKNAIEIFLTDELFRKQLNIPLEIIQKIENQDNWFDIKYNFGIQRINNNIKLQDIMNFLSLIGQIAQTDQSILLALDTYDIAKTIEELYGFDKSYLADKKQYEFVKQQLQELRAQTLNIISRKYILQNSAATEDDINRTGINNLIPQFSQINVLKNNRAEINRLANEAVLKKLKIQNF
jgi:hypothetical protein